MTRNDQGDSIGRQALAHRAGCAGMPGLRRQATIGERSAVRNLPTPAGDSALELRLRAGIDPDVLEIIAGAVSVGLEATHQWVALEVDAARVGRLQEGCVQRRDGLTFRPVTERKLLQHVLVFDQSKPAERAWKCGENRCFLFAVEHEHRFSHELGGVAPVWTPGGAAALTVCSLGVYTTHEL